jgi:hypothetical protein
MGKLRYTVTFLDLGSRWKWVVSFTLTLGGKNPVSQWIESWVGPRFSLGAVEKRKILYCRESKPDCSARRPSLYRLNINNQLFSVNKIFIQKLPHIWKEERTRVVKCNLEHAWRRIHRFHWVVKACITKQCILFRSDARAKMANPNPWVLHCDSCSCL